MIISIWRAFTSTIALESKHVLGLHVFYGQTNVIKSNLVKSKVTTCPQSLLNVYNFLNILLFLFF